MPACLVHFCQLWEHDQGFQSVTVTAYHINPINFYGTFSLVYKSLYIFSLKHLGIHLMMEQKFALVNKCFTIIITH